MSQTIVNQYRKEITVVPTMDTRTTIVSFVGLQGPKGDDGADGAGSIASGSFTGNGAQAAFDMAHDLGQSRVRIAFFLTDGTNTDDPCEIDWYPVDSNTARTRFVSPLPDGFVVRWKATP